MITPSRPPDTYKCKKAILKNVMNDNDAFLRITDAVIRMNHLTILVYQFIKAYYLYCIDTNIQVPTIDEDGNFVGLVFRVVSQGSNRGPPLKYTNAIIVKELESFYEAHFKQVLYEPPISRHKLSGCIGYAKVTIMTGFQNNIKVHFMRHLFGYINVVFDEVNKEVYESLITKSKKKIYRVELRRELKKVKNDILNNTLTAEEKYHKWITENRSKIVPSEYEVSIPYDVKVTPLKYLQFMIYMNTHLEKMGKRQFHCFPLRTDIVPKCIEIDTATLLELCMDTDTKQYRNGKNAIENAKPFLWDKYFKMNNKAFTHNKDYTFDYGIKTDGVSISTRFILKKFYNKKVPKSNAFAGDEFPYLEDLSKEQQKDLKEAHCVYVDPNKGNLIYCIDDDDKVFRYTRAQRLNETKRLKAQKTIKKFKKEHNISAIETTISEHNSKTCDFKTFMNYLKAKNIANVKLFEHYEKDFIRKLKLRTYINTQRSESKLIRNLNTVYKTDERPVVMIYGDCNIGKQMKHIISTPMIGLKRTIAKVFPVINFDEYRTSCLDWRTEKYNNNAKVMDKHGKTKKLHSVLVSTIPNNENTECKTSFQNRDRNSVLNIKKITKWYLEKGERIYNYRRDIKLPERNLEEKTVTVSAMKSSKHCIT